MPKKTQTKNKIPMMLRIDQHDLDEYNKYYFKKYPRRRKPPIKSPVHPSINTWMILKRLAMNKLKQDWKEFICWWIEKQGMTDLKLDEIDMWFISYMPTKRRADPDNTVPKFILDGMVESGFIVDDSGYHLSKLSMSTAYDKNNPHTDIYITKGDKNGY